MPKDRTEATVITTARSHTVHMQSQLKQLQLRAEADRLPTTAQIAHVTSIAAEITRLLKALYDSAGRREIAALNRLANSQRGT